VSRLHSRRTGSTIFVLALAMAVAVPACAGTKSSAGPTGGSTATTAAAPVVGAAPTAEPTAVSTAPARPSAGCSTSGATAPGAQPDQKMTVDGVERTYRLYVPPAATTGTPMPVVLNLHGLTSNIDQESAVSQYEPLAVREGFVVITPQGLGQPSRWGFENVPGNPDLPFFEALLDQVEARVCVDTARVYSSGISNGGMMSSTLACQFGGRIAAIGLVSGIREPNGCTPPDKATPVMVFWGTKDAVLPYAGGLGAGLMQVLGLKAPAPSSTENFGFPPVEQVVGEWATHDGCRVGPTVFPIGSEVEERVWSGCADDAQVRFYVVADGGHNWPGSKVMAARSASNSLFGMTTVQVDATALMWEFFRGYALTD
jgi:polyhydroxybutyrate depolymerase